MTQEPASKKLLMRPCPHCDGQGELPSGQRCFDCNGAKEVHNLCGQPRHYCECPADDDIETYRDKPIKPSWEPPSNPGYRP